MSRTFNVKIEDNGGVTISVDGKIAVAKWRPEIITELNSYHPELDATDEIISIIIQEINAEFNLTDNESQEYAQTLKHILTD